jgi:predicted nucleic acid-binding protein
VATNDQDARLTASRSRVRLSGTIGILTACIHQELVTLPDGNALLAEMIAAGYHSPVRTLDSVLNP